MSQKKKKKDYLKYSSPGLALSLKDNTWLTTKGTIILWNSYLCKFQFSIRSNSSFKASNLKNDGRLLFLIHNFNFLSVNFTFTSHIKVYTLNVMTVTNYSSNLIFSWKIGILAKFRQNKYDKGTFGSFSSFYKFIYYDN